MSNSDCSLLVLISGNGSNLQAIIDHIESGQLAATICGVISDHNDAHGLKRAQQHHIKTETVICHPNETRQQYDQRLIETIDTFRADWIILAGFMRIFSARLVNRYLGRMVNIHPSLLPAYKGLNTHQRVLDAGERYHGASVHFVTPELDDGPVIMQGTLAIRPQENIAQLKQRVHRIEHRIYPEVLKLLCTNHLHYADNTVYLDGKALFSPLTEDDPCE